jgi:malate/lactate dehydrogenase
VKLGRAGVEQIIEIKLTAEEDAALKKSAASVEELYGRGSGVNCQFPRQVTPA